MVMLHCKDLHLFYGVLRSHQSLLLTLILVRHMLTFHPEQQKCTLQQTLPLSFCTFLTLFPKCTTSISQSLSHWRWTILQPNVLLTTQLSSPDWSILTPDNIGWKCYETRIFWSHSTLTQRTTWLISLPKFCPKIPSRSCFISWWASYNRPCFNWGGDFGYSLTSPSVGRIVR